MTPTLKLHSYQYHCKMHFWIALMSWLVSCNFSVTYIKAALIYDTMTWKLYHIRTVSKVHWSIVSKIIAMCETNNKHWHCFAIVQHCYLHLPAVVSYMYCKHQQSQCWSFLQNQAHPILAEMRRQSSTCSISRATVI